MTGNVHTLKKAIPCTFKLPGSPIAGFLYSHFECTTHRQEWLRV